MKEAILKKLTTFLFYLILFLIPCNLARHWPQNWSYANGILIDYLIPTLYLTDILIILLLLLWLWRSLSQRQQQKNNQFKIKLKKLLIPFSVLLYFLLNLIIAKNKLASLYKFAKIIELSLFVFYIKNNINIKKDIKKVINVLSLSVVWQSILTISQWFKQGSIFGYWFFGEQPYNTATLGIKAIDFFGKIKVVPMGTFPHPNVLAGFLTISLILILSYFNNDRGLFLKLIAFLLGIIALFLTFSFPACLVLLVVGGWWLTVKKIKRKREKGFIGLISLVIFIGFIGLILRINTLASYEKTSLTRRIELNQIAVKMWLSSPIFGVGLNNFIVRMEDFGQIIGSTRFLQPVHNIYLLILAETGIIGLISLMSLIRLMKKRKALLVFLALLFLSLFDHYFFTIQQGMLILALVLGLTSATATATASSTTPAASAGKTA